MKFIEKIQNLLPIGYLFLVIMGILKESLLYYQLGINILKYSTIMDILISPIADLTSNPIVLVGAIIMLLFPVGLIAYFSKKSDRKWIQKISGLKATNGTLSEGDIKNHFAKLLAIVLTTGLLSYFLGLGIGEGHSIREKIRTNKLKYDHRLNFNSGESESIYLIGSNSVYCFYVTKGDKFVKIAPVGGIKNIELTLNKML